MSIRPFAHLSCLSPAPMAVLMLVVLVAGCGGDNAATTDAAAPVGIESAGTPTAADTATDGGTEADPGDTGEQTNAAFPVAIEHRFGTTEVAAEPERIVALGYTELDFVLALGHVPVAARYPQFGDTATPVRAWAADTAGDADIEVLDYQFGEIDYEEVAALDPDLILAVTSGILQEEYDQLSGIAPTVAQSGDYVDFGMPWQEITGTIGRSLGQVELAEELVADVESQFAQAREAHPDFEGLTVASAYYGAGEVLFFASEDLRARLFVDLGMQVPAELDEIAGEAFFGSISLEQLELIDTDVLVWSQLQFTDGGRDAIDADPLVAQLDAIQEGRTLYLDGEIDDALQVSTILSLPTALDGIVPMLDAAADGDPSTTP